MQYLTDLLTAIIIGYVGFTQSLATDITIWLAAWQGAEAEEAPLPSDGSEGDFSALDLQFKTVPDILLKNAEYQAAAVIGSEEELVTTTDPAAALVNIYCTFTTDRTIRTTTGTGFFVSHKGVILTNAHVAQFLLLETTETLGDAACTIRTGSPAAPAYTADLLYISPAWVAAYADQIDAVNPSGTGERDYALLYVTGTIGDRPLPSVFPALALNADNLSHAIKNTGVIASGYPVGRTVSDTASGLYAAGATTTVSELYTFGSNYADVFAMRGTDVGAQGSSGGPVTTVAGVAIGMITTRGDDTVDGPGSLRAITMSHINRTIVEETGLPLEDHLKGDLARKATVFSETIAPFLASILANEAAS